MNKIILILVCYLFLSISNSSQTYIPRLLDIIKNKGTAYLDIGRSGGTIQHIRLIHKGKIDKAGYDAFNNIAKDIRANKTIAMDFRLIDSLYYIQNYLRIHYNIKANIWLTSGYRTPQTNIKTKGASKTSFHMTGQAVDFYVEDINIHELVKILKPLHNKGGLGISYKGHIHLDSGTQYIKINKKVIAKDKRTW